MELAMPAVHFEHVFHSYSLSSETLVDASAHLGVGWTGIVGSNGSGKSTLLGLVARTLNPDSGVVSLDPDWTEPVLCPQTVEHLTPLIEAFGRSDEGGARRWHGKLRLDPDQLDRWAELSPGERKRWQIGAALALRPEILLLDEPTNHLDDVGRRTLLAALLDHQGVGLVVSHDRWLLDALTTQTLTIMGGRLESWAGSYSEARRAWTAASIARQEEHRDVRREQRKLARRLADHRRSAEKKNAAFQRSLRRARPGDRDARSMGKKIRHEAGAAAGARRMKVVKASSERTADQLAALDVDRAFGRSLFFDYQPCRRTRLLSYEGPLLAGSTRLAEYLDLQVLRDDRIHLAGPNGAGKTTLIEALIDGNDLPPDKLLYLPQELGADGTHRTIDRLRELSGESRGRVLSLVAALGVDPERLLASAQPSQGEVRKLAMAFGLGLNAFCLVLDEPTNHMDLPSVERLEAALSAYPGALLLVCHDETFVERTTRSRWTLEVGRLVVGSG
jgi:ATPase subunit of ABC transporter with duplicated ATPase domains